MRLGIIAFVLAAFAAGIAGQTTGAVAQQTGDGSNVIYAVKKLRGASAPQTSPQPSVTSSPEPGHAHPPHADAHADAAHKRNESGRASSSASSSDAQRAETGHTGSSNPAAGDSLVERVARRNLGSEAFQRLLHDAGATASGTSAGRGAPNADRWFDVQRPDGGSGTASQSAPAVSGAFKPATVQDAQQTTTRYGGIPGGIVLEGAATGIGSIESVKYDRRFNAFIVNDRAVYFMRIPPNAVAVMCRAIAKDDRIGVSLGDAEIVYGRVPKDSALAWDLKLADHFLGDIVFAENDWTRGYKFAGGFVPAANEGASYPIAVFFTFRDFTFRTERDEIRLAGVNFDVRLLPLSNSLAADGNLLPDVKAIQSGRVSPQYEANARHIAQNIAYYRRERIVDRMFAYGEVASFLRALKRADFDLEALAANIPAASRDGRTAT